MVENFINKLLAFFLFFRKFKRREEIFHLILNYIIIPNLYGMKNIINITYFELERNNRYF